MDIQVIYDIENNRSVAIDNDAEIGTCEYIIENDETWNIVHTHVNENYKGKGIAKRLVNIIIKKAKENNIKLVVDCSYAKSVIDKLNNNY